MCIKAKRKIDKQESRLRPQVLVCTYIGDILDIQESIWEPQEFLYKQIGKTNRQTRVYIGAKRLGLYTTREYI
jgi:hypothetical protein